MDKIVVQLLEKKGVRVGDSNFAKEKERITEELTDAVSNAVVDAMVDVDRVELLKNAIEQDKGDDAIRDIILGSELRIGVIDEAIENFSRKYLEVA